MRLGRRAYWAAGLLLGVVGILWFLGENYPDQVFAAYLSSRNWIATIGSKEAPTADSPQRFEWQPRFVVLPAGAAVLIKFRGYWSVIRPDDLDSTIAFMPSLAASVAKSGGTWQPAEDDIAQLEANLGQVSRLEVEKWPAFHKMEISNPANYFRQYVGIKRNKKRLIYVNAFCRDLFDGYPPPYWRQHLL